MSDEDIIKSFNRLRALIGYVRNDSSTVITLFQDDATQSFILKIKFNPKYEKSYWGDSLRQVIDKAWAENPSV